MMAELVPVSEAGGIDKYGTRAWRDAAARCVGPAASAVRAGADARHVRRPARQTGGAAQHL